jgi:hypothetical protein
MSTAAGFFSRLFDDVHSRAQEKRQRNEQLQDEERQMYMKVLLDPATSEEQREAAGKKIDQLMGLKGKDSQYSTLAGILNQAKKAASSAKQSGGAAPSPQDAAAAPAAGYQGAPQARPDSGPKDDGGAKMNLGGGRPMDEKTPIGGSSTSLPPMTPSASKVQKATKGLPPLDAGMSGEKGPRLGFKGRLKSMVSGQGFIPELAAPPSLPPLDTSVFPTGEQRRTGAAADVAAQQRALTQAEIDRFNTLFPNASEEDKRLYFGLSSADKKVDSYVGADNKRHLIYQRRDGSRYEEVEGEVRPLARDRRPAWTKNADGSFTSVLLDGNNQIIPGSQQKGIVPPASIAGRISTGQYHYVDDDGNLHSVTETRYSGPASSGKTKEGESSSSPRSLPPLDGKGGGTKTSATTEGKTSVPGDKIIGKKTTPEDTTARQLARKRAEQVAPTINILNDIQDYVKSGDYSPRRDIQVVVAAVRAMNPGSVRLPVQELQMEIKAGSYGDRARRWYDVATTGLLPDDQRQDLLKVVQSEVSHAAKAAAEDWQQYMRHTPPPKYLQPFASQQFTVNGALYNIPYDKVDEFKRDHPNASTR